MHKNMKKLFNRSLNLDNIEQKVIIYNYLLLIYWFSFLTPYKALPSISAIVLTIFWLISGDWSEKIQALKDKKQLYLWWLGFLAWEFLSIFYASDVFAGLSIFQRHHILGLILPPLLFSLNYLPINWQSLTKKMIFILLFFTIIHLIWSLIRYFYLGMPSTIFWGENLIILSAKHNGRYALYVNTAILILLSELRNSEKKYFLFYIFSLGIFFLTLILLGTRNSILTGIFLSILYIGTQILPTISWKKRLIWIGFGVIFLSTIPIFFPRLIQRFKSSTQIEINWENTNHINDHFGGEVSEKNWEGTGFRLAIWHCAWDKIQEKWLFGYGLGDTQKVLREAYKNRNFTLAFQNNVAAHNQYLTFWLGTGLIGLILFLTQFFILLKKAKNLKNWEYLYFIILLLLASATEETFTVQEGIFFIFLFYPLLMNRAFFLTFVKNQKV